MNKKIKIKNSTVMLTEVHPNQFSRDHKIYKHEENDIENSV